MVTIGDLRTRSLTQHLARRVLTAFVFTFAVARATVVVTAMGWTPNLHVQLGGTHVHHLNFGIFLLSIVGAYLIFVRPEGKALREAALAYGIGLALTFDEFGMWLHLEDHYWQRASYDAVVVIMSLLGLLIAAPTLRRFRRRHWATAAGMAMAVALFGILVVKPLFKSGE